MKIQSIRGMNDIGESEIHLWHFVENKIRKLSEAYNFFEVRTPVLESTQLFKRSVGDTSDIVEKEMYTFTDRNGESLSLRPEGTASVARAVIEHNWAFETPGLKMYYLAPMFRHERPQKGRYRQFHQFGTELLGVEAPHADVEVIALAHALFQDLGIHGIELQISSVGCETCRPNYKKLLQDKLAPHKEKLCEDCQRRFDTNPMRVLDCKVKSCKEIAVELPGIVDHLCATCVTHFNGVRDGLIALQIPFRVNPKIVRGLDYYVRTAFEFINNDETLGAQSTVCGGGRYDRLIEQLGGKPTPAVGFGMGLERLTLLLETRKQELIPKVDLYCVVADEAARTRLQQVCFKLRSAGLRVEMDLQPKSMKSQLKRANKLQARYSLILGSQELEKQMALLKDMSQETQIEVPMDTIEKEILMRF